MDVRRGSVGSNGKGVRMGAGCAGGGPVSQPLCLALRACSFFTGSLAARDDDQESREEGETLSRADQRPEITVETLRIRSAS